MNNMVPFFGKSLLRSSEILGPLPSMKEAYQKYWKVAWPAIFQGLLVQLSLVIDLAMVGGLGANAIAAVGIMEQPIMVFLVFVRSLSIPIIAMVARKYGEKDYEGLNIIFQQGVVLVLLIYIPLTGLIIHFLPHVVVWAGAQPEIIYLAVTYGKYVLLGLMFSAFTQIVGATLIGLGKTKIIFTAYLIGNIIKTILTIFLIYGIWIFPRLEVEGAGIANMIGHIVTTAFIVSIILSGRLGIHFKVNSVKHWHFTKDFLHNVYHLGGSSLGEQSFERFGMFVYTKMVASLGVVPLATHFICMNLCDLFYLLLNGLSQASAAYTGQNLGAKRPDLAVLYGRLGARLALLIALVGGLIYYFFADSLLHVFTSSSEVVELGKDIILILAIACVPQAFQMVYAGVLRGAGDNFFVMLYSLGSIAIIRPILTYFLCFIFDIGLYGAWLALLSDQILRMLCSGYRFRQGYWKSIQL